MMKMCRIPLVSLGTASLAALVGPFLVPVPPLKGTYPARALADADSIQLPGELPNARLAFIKNAGHVPHEERPGAFMDAVRNFLSTMYL